MAVKRDIDIAGIGSTVVDIIHDADSILGPESKGLLRGASRHIGGVTLNHLCWASVLGVNASLFGIGADDEAGHYLRRGLDAFGVNHDHYLKSGLRTAQSQIFVDPRGERAIYMDFGATGATKPADMARFKNLLARCHFVSTEISQLPLNSVLTVLSMARELGARSFLDLDLPPSQAVSQGLGTRAQLEQAIREADFLKSSMDAAKELVTLADPGATAQALHRHLGKKAGTWVALTAGSKGAGISNGRVALSLPAGKVAKVRDTTGAGDAFLGGLIAGSVHGLDLGDLLKLANACGAANVTRLGAVPDPRASLPEIMSHYRGKKFMARTVAPKSVLAEPGYLKSAVEQLALAAARVGAASLAAAKALVLECEAEGGRLHVTGIGKTEPLARYIAASLSSTGTPAFFLHGTEAVHGSAGQVGEGEVVIAISNSGETPELKAAVSTLKNNGARIIGVTSQPSSWLARESEVFLRASVDAEGDPLNMPPRNSVLAELLVLNALGVELQTSKDFSVSDFQRFHPGGSLGRSRPRPAKKTLAGR